MSTHTVCDFCGKQGDTLLHVDMRSGYGSEESLTPSRPQEVHLDFCEDHGRGIAGLLGFVIDAGVLLSKAQGEYATGESDIPKQTPRPDELIAAGASLAL